jgi:hypothetical protein
MMMISLMIIKNLRPIKITPQMLINTNPQPMTCMQILIGIYSWENLPKKNKPHPNLKSTNSPTHLTPTYPKTINPPNPKSKPNLNKKNHRHSSQTSPFTPPKMST